MMTPYRETVCTIRCTYCGEIIGNALITTVGHSVHVNPCKCAAWYRQGVVGDLAEIQFEERVDLYA